MVSTGSIYVNIFIYYILLCVMYFYIFAIFCLDLDYFETIVVYAFYALMYVTVYKLEFSQSKMLKSELYRNNLMCIIREKGIYLLFMSSLFLILEVMQ